MSPPTNRGRKRGKLDDLDRRILYALQEDARRISSNDIAAGLDVAASTVRNRIKILEEEGIIRGYDLDIDYENAYQLYTLIVCTAPVPQREELARKAQDVPGVVKVREVMTGEENVHVGVVGEDKNDLNRIGRDLDKLGLHVADEDLIHHESHRPFDGFNPERGERRTH